jgi:hypothetical protein
VTPPVADMQFAPFSAVNPPEREKACEPGSIRRAR